jgi:4'-phosphopantetheinyl transferase
MLNLNSIYVWRIGLEASASASETRLGHWYGMLSPEERKRADAFRGAGLRRDYIVAHAALRSVLGRWLGVSPALVRFAPDAARESGGGLMGAAAGKPVLMPDSGRPDLRFNLSHTRGAALIGVALGCELGIDIEWQRPMDDLEGMARSVMSDEELAIWQSLETDERTAAFYHLWTRKEAYLKAIGLGLYRSLHEVTVPVSARRMEGLPNGGLPVRDRAGKGVWTVADIAVADGYSASVCCEGDFLPPLVIEDLSLDSIGQEQP